MFVAYDKDKDLNVAVKACEDQGEVDRGDREATILQKLFELKHPNIAAFLSRSALSSQPLVLNSK